MWWWSLLIYGLAALWGLRLLLTMMDQHRRQHAEKLRMERFTWPAPSPPSSTADTTPPSKAAT